MSKNNTKIEIIDKLSEFAEDNPNILWLCKQIYEQYGMSKKVDSVIEHRESLRQIHRNKLKKTQPDYYYTIESVLNLPPSKQKGKYRGFDDWFDRNSVLRIDKPDSIIWESLDYIQNGNTKVATLLLQLAKSIVTDISIEKSKDQDCPAFGLTIISVGEDAEEFFDFETIKMMYTIYQDVADDEITAKRFYQSWLIGQGRFLESLKLNLESLNPDDPWTFYNVARDYHFLGDFENRDTVLTALEKIDSNLSMSFRVWFYINNKNIPLN